ncbi:MAG: AraC family transcriptional regulator [Massiliimalia sp.]|jgi:AraC-like DNA-binding protein
MHSHSSTFPYKSYSFSDQWINTGHSKTNLPSKDFSLHCHDSYEIYYFMNGDVRYLVEGREYHPVPGSMFLFYPNVFHGFKVDSDLPYERCTLHFSPNMFPPETAKLLLTPFQPNPLEQTIYYPNAESFHIESFFSQLFQATQMPKKIRDNAIRIRMENLLLQILMMSQKTESSQPIASFPIAEEIIHYLNNHLADPITLDSLSKQFFVSKYHLGNLFKKATGTTVMDYIIRKRLAAARQLIAQGVPAGEASNQVGFRDYSVFFRAYKKVYACAPTSLRESL